MSFVKIPDEILDADISSAQFRILANLIKYSFDNNHSYIGYAKLADACYTSKSFVIKAMKDLENKGFIQILHRGSFSRSNDILLTFENGKMRHRSTGDFMDDAAPKGCLNDTPKGCLNDTPKGCLNDTHGCLNDTPYIDKRFKYQDLNLKTRDKGCLNDTPKGEMNKNIAPADVASGRSMPSRQAGTSSASDVQAENPQFELEDACLFSAFKEVFPDIAVWAQFVRLKNRVFIRSIGATGEQVISKNWDNISGWFGLRGQKVGRLNANERFLNEIAIGG